MNPRAASAWCSMAIALAGQSVPVNAAASHAYVSPAGFALRYPATWTRADASSKRLLIVSPGHRVQGPVIGPDQAAILVRILDADDRVPPTATRASVPPGKGEGCRPWLEQETRDASDPGPIEVDRRLYCVGRGRTILVQLTYWADDPRSAVYVRAATAVAASVRLVGKPVRHPSGSSGG